MDAYLKRHLCRYRGRGCVGRRREREMRRGRIITAATAFVAAVAVGAPSALAATPQQIYKDYADNGRLDGHYSKSDLQRALHDAVIQGYKPTTSVAPAIKKKINQSGVAGANLPAAKRQGALPFT